MYVYFSQGEFLHGLAVVYENMYDIDEWWIGLTDLGMFQPLIFKGKKQYIITCRKEDHLTQILLSIIIEKTGEGRKWHQSICHMNLP
jgi:hypothetical protein